MTGDVSALAGGGCHIFSGCGFPAPGLQDFNWKPFFSIGSFHFTKPMLIAVICMISVIAFFWAAFARPKIVPRGVQNLGYARDEGFYFQASSSYGRWFEALLANRHAALDPRAVDAASLRASIPSLTKCCS